MTTLRRIPSWLNLLQRPCTWSCRKAAITCTWRNQKPGAASGTFTPSCQRSDKSWTHDRPAAASGTFTPEASTETLTPELLAGTFAPRSLAGTFPPGSLAGTSPPGSLAGTFPPGSLAGIFSSGSLAGIFSSGSLAGTFPPGSLAGIFSSGSLAGTFTLGLTAGTWSHHSSSSLPLHQKRGRSVLQSRTFMCSACRLKNTDEPTSSGFTSEEEEEEEDEDFLEDSEVEELFQQQALEGIAQGHHRVFIVHPDVKWGSRKQYLTTADLMVAEAVGLINTLENWTVVDKIILSTKTPQKKRIFGKGNFQLLTEKIKQTAGITAVFINVERLSPLSEREFEDIWGVKVFDRYSVVLHIFRCNARTKEAKLQISLAEMPLLRSRLKNEMSNLDQQGGGSRYIGGSGETLFEVQQRLLKERELRIRLALEKLRRKRHLLRSQRKHKEFPIVSVLGYTNCGKTTLIKALTGDSGLQPKNQLFATLDVTVHAGLLPCRLTVLYVDTIGFLSQLPHQLIDSFSATLEDIKHSDLLVHVRDISHPETVNQKENVLNVLKNLQVPDKLMSSMIEVHNKTDLVDKYECSEPGVLPISALKEQGLDKLKKALEEEIVKSTGKQVLDLKVDLSTSQLSWLYKEAAVQDVKVDADEGSAVVNVLISNAAYGRYKKLFRRD